VGLESGDGKSGHTDSDFRKWTIEGISINLIHSTAKGSNRTSRIDFLPNYQRQVADAALMGFFKKLFGKSDSRAVKLARKALYQAEKESEPYRVLGFAIIEAAIRCLERIKPFFLPGKGKTEAHLTEFWVFNEFLYFFMHMSNRAAFSEGFNEQERNAFLEKLFPGLIATVIDLFAEDLPEEIKEKFRGEFYDNVHSAEIGYSMSKELVSKEYKPLSGDSLLAKLSGNVAAKMDKQYNPEVLTQVTLAAFEELRNADIPKLVAGTRTALRNQPKD
jgi:hypothetical protein